MITGPRAAGKTATAARHAATIVRLDRPAEAAVFRADADSAAWPGTGRLVWMRDRLGDRFSRGILFHAGPTTFELSDRITALPIHALW
jgi:hypothetical protein